MIKASKIKDAAETILNKEETDLVSMTYKKCSGSYTILQWITQEEQDKLDQQVEKYQLELKKKEQDIFSMHELEIKKLKEEIEELRDSRSKLRSHVSSVSSSVTIYPTPDTPSLDTPSPDKPSPDEPSPDAPSPDKPSPDEPSPDAPSPDKPSPDVPSSENQSKAE